MKYQKTLKKMAIVQLSNKYVKADRLNLKKIVRNLTIAFTTVIVILDIVLFVNMKQAYNESKLISTVFEFGTFIYGLLLLPIVWIQYFLILGISKVFNKYIGFKKCFFTSLLAIIDIGILIIEIRILWIIFLFMDIFNQSNNLKGVTMKKELSDFLKMAYKYNKVKELKEAFEEFPVEEEWHKGKVENVITENKAHYNVNYAIGDIVFVKEYIYSNGEKGTNHFFVIIDKDNMAVPIENFGMIISSNLEKLKYKANKLLKKDSLNNLHRDSIVKTDVIYKILNEQIVFKIGTVDKDKVEEYKKSFYEELKKEK